MENEVHTFINKRGGIKLNVNGFIYEKNRENNNKYYWVCELRRKNEYKCNSRIITKLNADQQHELLSNKLQSHNHEPNAARAKVQTAINKIKDDAKSNPDKKPIQIIADLETITSPSVLSNMPSKFNLKQTIYRQRKLNNKITEPQDIHFELMKENFLQENDLSGKENDNQIIIIDKKYETNRRIIIFTTKKLITILCTSKYIMMDGTFKVVPKIFHQLYTIHGCVHKSQTFPLVFALCTNKDKNTYNLLLTSIIDYCEANDLNLSPRFIIMDFEKTAHICARQIFENTTVKGCNFHLGQIIYRKIQKYSYQKLYGNDISFTMEIKCIYALAFLPEDDIPIYFDEWRKAISPQAEQIANWFNNNYVWGTVSSPPLFPPKIWSTYQLTQEDIPRTQNYAEAWHNRFAHFVGRDHPGFYYLAQKLTQEIKHQTIEIEKIDMGTTPTPTKKKKYTDKHNRIENIIHNKINYPSKLAYLQAIPKNINLK